MKPVKKPTPSLFDVYADDEPSQPDTSFVNLVGEKPPETTFAERVRPEIASGEKAKARDITAAIKVLKDLDARLTPATPDERAILARFPGFGPVALSIFPNPATGEFKPGWEEIGKDLKELLTDEEYASAKRTTFNAFYTSPVVIDAMHAALQRLGVPENALVLEPGCGPGRFLSQAPEGMRFLGVELDSITGRIVKTLYPQHDIRVQNFRDTQLPPVDAVIGNVPFADVKYEHQGQKFSLHDYFFAKSVDALKPGGVLALVTSHYTLDKQNAAIREYLSERADFLGAIRLPSDAFKKEGTAVVTDIVFLRKRSLDEPPSHADPDWLSTEQQVFDGHEVSINRYFLHHPEQVLGTYSGKDSLYGSGYSVLSNGDLADQLKRAVDRLPEAAKPQLKVENQVDLVEKQVDRFVPPPPERHISEGSFFVHEGRIHQVVDGNAAPVVYGGGELWANGALFGRRMSNLIELRDKARRVLQSQNDGWPESEREKARADLNRSYDWFRSAYGPINKTTVSSTKDGGTIRRMPNLALFREDPDAMLVMALEEYDEATGEAKKAPILRKDVVGKTPPITSVASAEEGLLVSLNHHGTVDLPYIAKLYGKPEGAVVAELGDLIFENPETGKYEPADQYLSGNVRSKLAVAEKAGIERNVAALKAVQPEDVLPGDIDANLGAPWIPVSDIKDFATHLFKVDRSSITVAHLAKDAVWSVEGDYSAQNAVAATADFGTSRANGLWLFELALNMKSPVIYDPDPSDPDKRVVNQEQTLAAKEKQKLIKEAFKQWVFSDPDRTERLVRLYNDNFNNIRLRQFDGSHLDFPGMSQGISLRQHQKDVIWRCMSGGNTLIAHTVGAGKTFSAAATAMKMKQAGLVKKPLLAVPNHLLEQFAREFQQLYPNAKLLVATKDDFTKERRKFLTAKIASGDWDAIIVTHSSFERIGMSREFQAQFLRDQIADYDALLTERAADKYSKAKRNVLKVIEKQKAAREAKLKDLLAEDKKDTGVVFDELGVDEVIVDECFIHDTMIDTDHGLLKIGEVVTKRLPVHLRTWNYKTGVIEWRPVVNWFANRRKGPLVEVVHEFGSFICTPGHKLWIDGLGYKTAGQVAAGESLLVLRPGLHSEIRPAGRQHAESLLAGVQGQGPCDHEDVRVVRGRVLLPDDQSGERDQAAPAVLQRQLQNASTTGESIERSEVQSVDAAVLGQPADEGTTQSRGGGADEGGQPDEVSGEPGESVADVAGDGAQAEGAGREWSSLGAADVARGAHGDGYGICDPDQADPSADGGFTQALQGRPGRSGTELGGRGGRAHPPLRSRAGAGCEEGRGPVTSRVVRVAVLEPGSDGEYRLGGRAHSVVYDLEVADNHNYFANGVLVSNCHAYKNLETPTKMDRVAGIQTGGSERAFDLLMKATYLGQQHPGHGIIGMSGTPISNSMVEMYTMQRYFDPDGLRARSIEHFDAWAATFGEVVEAMEISPDGKTLKPRSRFAKFVNLPELQQMFRQFADVQTAEMLNLPRPALEGGKPHVVACPMSDEQHTLQDELVKRYEKIRSEKVDPRIDNALAITTDGRKLALDARMLSSAAMDFPESKINRLVENVVAIWQRTAESKGTQMVFCDMGVHPTEWGFSAYDEVVAKLVARGIPKEQIAAIGDADTDAKKQALFEKVRQGSVRVLLGSTAKLGTGTNVQKRLVALHHLDAPWKPAEVEQRDGRILRQGNENAEVAVYRYVTEGSFDAYMWQALETKAKFINQVMTGESGVRRAEDVGSQELSYSEVKALASGNPAFLTLAEADAEIQRLAVLRRNHADAEFIARRKLRELPQEIERVGNRLAALRADAETVRGTGGFTVRGNPGDEKVLAKALDAVPDRVDHRRQYPLGKYRGLTFGIERHPGGSADVYLEGQSLLQTMLHGDSQGPRAVTNALNRLATSYRDRIADLEKLRAVSEGQLRDYEARIGKSFAHAAYLGELTGLRDRLKVALSSTPAEGEPTAAELAAKITALKASHVVESPRMRKEPLKSVEKPREEAPKAEEPRKVEETPKDDEDDKPSFRAQVQRKGTQLRLF